MASIRSIGMTLLAVSGIFVAGVLLFNFVIMPLLIHNQGTVIVPDLVAVSENQASEMLARLSLNMRVERSENHNEIPDGYVISQLPRTNDSINEARTVVVVVSLGPQTQVVPELKGMSLRQARLVLSRSSLRVGRVARVQSEGESRDAVLASTPGVGSELVEGTPVDVVVAAGGGKKRFMMPDLTGQDLLFIREKLREMGFRISGVRYERRVGVFPNTVVGQSPHAGMLIRQGDSIELVAASSD